MSHYAVAVFADDPYDFDRLLAPYNESNKEYYEFVEVPFEQIKQEYEEFKKQNPKWTSRMYLKEFGYIKEGDKWGKRYNPHGYWDWYTLDGRDGLFERKPEFEDNDDEYLRKSMLDFFAEDEEAVAYANEFWQRYIVNEESDIPGWYDAQYYLDRYKTRKQFVKESSVTVPYAFITPDGVWHAPGQVGWFAISDETAESWNDYYDEWVAFINSEGDPYVSLVDCHI